MPVSHTYLFKLQKTQDILLENILLKYPNFAFVQGSVDLVIKVKISNRL